MNPTKFIFACVVAASLGGVVLLSGCRSTETNHEADVPEGGYVAVAKPNSPEAAGAKVVLLNYELVKRIAVDKPVVARRDQAGRLSVQAGVAQPDQPRDRAGPGPDGVFRRCRPRVVQRSRQ